MLRSIFTLLLCYVAITVTFANSQASDKSKAAEYLKLFEILNNSAEPDRQLQALYSDSVIFYSNKIVLAWKSKEKIDSEYFNFTFDFIDFLVSVRRPHDAKKLIDEVSAEIGEIKNPEQNVLVRRAYFYGLVYAELSRYDLSLDYYKQALQLNKDLQYSSKTMPIFSIYRGVAIAYFYLGNLKKAEKYAEIELEAILSSDIPNRDKYLHGGTYNTLAKINELQGDYNKANTYYFKELEYNVSTFGESSSKTAKCHYLVGRNLIGLRKFDLALDYLVKARETRKNVYGENSFLVGSCNASIGDCYYKQGDYPTAIKYYKKSLDTYQAALGKNHHMMAYARGKLGNCLLEYNRPKEALIYLTEAKETYIATVGDNHPQLSSYNTNLVDCYFELGELEKASQLIKRSIELLVPGYNSNDNNTLPNINDCVNTRMLLPVIIRKAKYHALKANTKDEISSSLLFYKYGVRLIDEIQKDYISDASKSELIGQFFEVYEGGIKASYRLNEKEQSEFAVESALYFSEKSKSMLLLQSFRDAGARKIAGISAVLLEQDENVRSNINYKKRLLFEELQKSDKSDKDYVKDLQLQLHNLYESRDNLIAKMEREYPNYFQMKYRSEICNNSCIQNRLPDDQELIEFFYTVDALYAIRINHNASKLYKLNNKNLTEDIAQYRSLLHSFNAMSPDERSYLQFCSELSSSSHTLYKKIIAPLTIDEPLKKSLIIVPDGILSYLPFDALLVSPPDNSHKFKKHEYLVNNHIISYANSATLYDELIDRKYHYNVYKLLGVAPTFEGNESYSDITFDPLQHNVHELNAINKSISAKKLVGEDASIENFLDLSQRYNIIHLATHAEANDHEPDFSYLAFAHSEEHNKPLLYVKDIYGIKLQAAMVVLSACNSGTGKLMQGEGIMSLARSFTFAGAGSIITSLWEVDDQQASSLMETYYKELSTGKSKDQSLQSAKLNYLREHDNYYCNPYFWATTIAIGDMRPINNGPSKSTTLLGIGGISALFLVLLLGKLKSS